MDSFMQMDEVYGFEYYSDVYQSAYCKILMQLIVVERVYGLIFDMD